MRHASRWLLAFLSLALLAPIAAADDPEVLRQKLAREGDPVTRAKITAELGEALVEQAARQYKAEDYDGGDKALAEYIEAVQSAYRGLADSGRDARRKPAGFKHLEIHLRKTRRKLEDLARRLPFPKRGPAETTIEEMENIRSELLRALMHGHDKPAGTT